MDRVERLEKSIYASGFDLNDIITTIFNFGKDINITFRDLVTLFMHCNTRYQIVAISKFEISRFDFKNRIKITNKNKLRELYAEMFNYLNKQEREEMI